MSGIPKNGRCMGAFLNLLGLGGCARPEPTYPYGVADAFLSSAEVSFFHVARAALPPEQYLIAKVRLSDLFQTMRPHENLAAKNRIDRRHVDFVVCDSRTMCPLLGIELDDAPHRARAMRDVDEHVDKTFAAAGLPLLRLRAGRTYRADEISERIRAVLGSTEKSSLERGTAVGC